ncbi:MAG: DUF4912 domain-containing protein [PVC group bacterium]|nr:DUF4912 domain-containing protein [PVC group bacterium]
MKKTAVKKSKSTKISKAKSKSVAKTKKTISRRTNVKSAAKLVKNKVVKPVHSSVETEVFPALAEGKQQVGESKFFRRPAGVQVQERDTYELPAEYGDTRIVIQVRDPYWIYSYWEINADKWAGLRQEFGDVLNSAKRMLRIYDITGVIFNGNNFNSFFDIEINDCASTWYINVGTPGRSYCVDIGLLLSDGKFITLARSNCVTTPLDGPSSITDEEWMVVEDDFNKLYGLSVGLGVGLSSADIKRKITQRLQSDISSGAISSFGSPVKKMDQKRGFWLVVNTELIVYGATEPDAKVTVQGRPIQLNKEGTFSLRFALPDGEQTIPVKAVSSDGGEKRVITPIVNKKTI